MKNEDRTPRPAALSGRDAATAAGIGVLLAVLYAFGLPGALLGGLYIGEVDHAYIARYGDLLLTACLGIVLTRLALPRFRAGFRAAGFGGGWRDYGFAGAGAFLAAYIGLVLGLRPFNTRPALGVFLFGGLLDYLCAALLEEFVYRGLLLRALSSLRADGRRGFPVLIAALLFTAGQLAGIAGALPPLALACHAVWALGLGLFLGAVFLRTGNLWLCALFSFFNRLGAAAYFFTTRDDLPVLSAVVILAVYALLGAYGAYLAARKE